MLKTKAVTKKSITFSNLTKPQAIALGLTGSGGWHLSQYKRTKENKWIKSHIPLGHEKDFFESSTDPELIRLFKALDGETCPFFKKYTNKETLNAINNEQTITSQKGSEKGFSCWLARG